MKREPSTAARALRAVSLVITLVSVVTVGTMAYSAYVDVNGFISNISSSSGQGLTNHVVVTGNTATLDLNYSVQNSGLYPLSIALSCQPNPSVPVSCSGVSVSIPAGSTQDVSLALTVSDLTKLQAMTSSGSPLHLNATADISLQPFATLSLQIDLGRALSGAP